MKHKYRFSWGIAFLLVVIGIYFLGGRKLLTLEHLQEYRLHLEQFIQQRYSLSVVLYIFLFVCVAVMGIPITVVLTIAAGYFFGSAAGTLYAVVGATIGAAISFLLFRYLLGSFVQKWYSQELAHFNQNIEKHGHHYLLTLQILPVTPTLLINVFAGMTKLKFWTFVWTTAVGILPGSLIYALAGRQLVFIKSAKDIFSTSTIALLIGLALLALVPLFFKRLKR